MKITIVIKTLLGVLLLVGVAIRAFSEDGEIKLNSNDGSTKLVVQNQSAVTIFSADSAGNVVITGTAAVAGSRFSVGGSTFVVKDGNIGIGTAGPSQKLEVSGTVQATSFLGDGSGLAGISGIVPVGAVIAWLKSFPNTPALPPQFVECNGQTLSDAGSLFNGQVIPNLNGNTEGTKIFLRGALASGGTGGTASATATSGATSGGGVAYSASSSGSQAAYASHTHSVTHTIIPPYYEVAWIMRVK